MKALMCCVAFCLLVSGSVFMGTYAIADPVPDAEEELHCDHPYSCDPTSNCLVVQDCGWKQEGEVREVWYDGRCKYQGQWNLQCCGYIISIGECGFPI
jgi:hypothetical protein